MEPVSDGANASTFESGDQAIGIGRLSKRLTSRCVRRVRRSTTRGIPKSGLSTARLPSGLASLRSISCLQAPTVIVRHLVPTLGYLSWRIYELSAHTDS